MTPIVHSKTVEELLGISEISKRDYSIRFRRVPIKILLSLREMAKRQIKQI